jgi:hypothetical protein
MKVLKHKNRKQKTKINLFIGLPPNKRYHFTPLARRKAKDSSVIILSIQTISSSHNRFTRSLKARVAAPVHFYNEMLVFVNKEKEGGISNGLIGQVLVFGNGRLIGRLCSTQR